MAIEPQIKSGRDEKALAGWFGGVNSMRTPWLLDDDKSRWAVNMVNRGGIWQVRPGYKLSLTAPAGNFQGLKMIRINKAQAPFPNTYYCVFAVDGKVYYAPFPLVQPDNWEEFRLKNIQFDPQAKQIYWDVATKNVVTQPSGNLQIVPSYQVLMMQDDIGPAAYWDGEIDAHTDEEKLETPRGSWMASSNGRLWIGRDNQVLASDLGDPLSFRERVGGTQGATSTATGRGDNKFVSTVTGLVNSIGQSRKSNLVVYTDENTSIIQSSILDRNQWQSTPDFQYEVLPKIGCVSGRSIVNHAGLLWWYSPIGLVNIDAASSFYVTSQTKIRDIEMAQSKRNFSNDLSGIAACSFENYLCVSVPSGDVLNGHTAVLDYAVANELSKDIDPPAWQGVWTGTRPIEWATVAIRGVEQAYFASVDYQAFGQGQYSGSFNHIWAAFQNDRTDSYDLTDSQGIVTTVRNPIYWLMETKLLGDSMDYKRFMYAELDLVELWGHVKVKVSVGGTKGGYHQILNHLMIATVDPTDIPNAELQALFAKIGFARVQSRRVRTIEALWDQNPSSSDGVISVESPYDYRLDKCFSLLIEGCGRAGIEALRMYMEPVPESNAGAAEEDESGYNVLTENGQSFKFN